MSDNDSTSSQSEQIIISLTSFPEAIPYAIGAIRSVLNGKVLPDKVVLYVTVAQFGRKGLPEELLDLERENPIFEIRDCNMPEIRSYMKLVPALHDFPDAAIVTIDDDVDYPPTMLGDLLKLHRRYPDVIVAHRAKHIIPDKAYRKWRRYKWLHFLTKRNYRRYNILQTGVGGVLYPPHSLKPEMIDPELFTRIAPTGDDLWFWAAAVANGTKVMPVPFGHNDPKGLGKPRELALKTVNFKSGPDRNFAMFRAILDNYPLIRQRLINGE